MNARGSGNSATALRRLMTEYKQLTSGGSSPTSRSLLFSSLLFSAVHRPAPPRLPPSLFFFLVVKDAFDNSLFQKVPPMACLQQVRLPPSPSTHTYVLATCAHCNDRSRVGIRFFHLGSPDMWSQRHPIRNAPLHHPPRTIHESRISSPFSLGRWRLCRQTHLCTFASLSSFSCHP